MVHGWQKIQTFKLGYVHPVLVGGETDSSPKKLHFDKPKNGSSNSVLLDFGAKVTGFLLFDLDSSLNAELLVDYGPTLESMFFQHTVSLGYANDRRAFADTGFLACRYIRLSIREAAVGTTACKAVLVNLRLKFSAYPADRNIRFISDSDVLNKVWEVGAYTTLLCIQKFEYSFCYRQMLDKPRQDFIANWKNPYSPYVIWDGPRRDREVWIGDVRTEALTCLYSLGVGDAVQSSLKLFADLQYIDGKIPGSGTTWQPFTEYCYWWIITFAEYLMFSGEEKFYRDMRASYRELMNWITAQMDERNFIPVENTWMWTFKLQGIVGEAQCVLYYALLQAAWVDSTFGSPELSSHYLELAATLRKHIHEIFWDEQLGVFKDRFIDSRYDQTVFLDFNSYAASLGVADEHQSRRVLEYIQKHMWTDHGTVTINKKLTGQPEKWGHNRTIWPFVVGFELEGLFKLRWTEKAHELIRRCWGSFFDHQATAFWEFKYEDGTYPLKPMIKDSPGDTICSYSHGWSGWVSYLMQRYVAGITPLEAGFRTVLLEPQLHTLKSCRASVHTPYGEFCVNYLDKNGRILLHIDAPAEVSVSISYTLECNGGRELDLCDDSCAAFVSECPPDRKQAAGSCI